MYTRPKQRLLHRKTILFYHYDYGCCPVMVGNVIIIDLKIVTNIYVSIYMDRTESNCSSTDAVICGIERTY
ncbi:hypothetical protein QTP88_026001 [Uroleucon formosanum]